MIESLTIQNVATYGSTPVSVDGLKKLNFIFGSNGTGKTTISRVIAKATGHKHCMVRWHASNPLETLVYNKDFVDRVFNQSSTVPGVFTLGEDQVNAENKIDAIKPEIDKLNKKINKLNVLIEGKDGSGGKNKELIELENLFKSQCWRQKLKHDSYFQVAFSGLRNNSDKFKEKILTEKVSNKADLCSLEDLKKRANTVFSSQSDKIDLIPEIITDTLLELESNDILKKLIIGKQDVDIAAMVQKLGNSDWVKKGLSYFEINDDICPFCQQSTSSHFSHSLNEFFNEAFEKDIEEVNTLISSYQEAADNLLNKLDKIIDSKHQKIDLEKLSTEKNSLKLLLEKNQVKINSKLSEPSKNIRLETISVITDKLTDQILAANEEILAHNQTIENIDNEKKLLIGQVWRFITNDIDAEISEYLAKKSVVQRSIDGMTDSIQSNNQKLTNKIHEVKELEKSTTSIFPTKETINDLLKSFGFSAFIIDVTDELGHYKICRSNGEDASKTLSEGEKTFITFLYFYHLIKGSNTASGISSNRIVVFDDPISSLDSDILYIVSSLIKGIFDDVRLDKGYVKQAFVLTHNVYFHKEVTFNPKRPNDTVLSEESFWMVRKEAAGSSIINYQTNPIKSAYELLWEEARLSTVSSLNLQNTLRRILENYFTMWGGRSKDEICSLFTGREKLICQSLFSWVNDGSHSIHDDLYISHGDQTNQAYLNVFKNIFEKADQVGHYNMMMGVLPRDHAITTIASAPPVLEVAETA